MPPLADQVTDLLLLPVMEAENCCVAPVATLTDTGVTEMDITGADTDTAALADFVLSAALVAVIV